MKKQTKLLVVLLALVMVCSVVMLTACETKETKVAYGLVHREGYVGIGTVVVKGDSLVSVSLDEACFPTQVKAASADGDYTVTVGEVHYWKTVKYGSVVMTYDATDGYKVGTQTIKEFFKSSETNCKAYAEAVQANQITVVTSAGEKKDIMTAATLLKSQNGYWSGSSIHENQLGWKANVEATCAYVMKNGFNGAADKADFVVSDNSATNPNLDNELVDKNAVKTGATWTDMWDYFSLLKTAYAR